jgi:hypothetical protein
MRAHRRSGGTAPFILNLSTTYRWVVSLVSWLLYPWENIHWTNCVCCVTQHILKLCKLKDKVVFLYATVEHKHNSTSHKLIMQSCSEQWMWSHCVSLWDNIKHCFEPEVFIYTTYKA